MNPQAIAARRARIKPAELAAEAAGGMFVFFTAFAVWAPRAPLPLPPQRPSGSLAISSRFLHI